jgi:uncharacterized protein YjiS (DUF1127 family)
MPNPKSGTLDLGGGASPLASSRLAAWMHWNRPTTRIGSGICALATRFLAWRAQQATLRLLRSLDAATLRDLGLTDIESEVRGDPSDRLRGYDANWRRERHQHRVRSATALHAKN